MCCSVAVHSQGWQTFSQAAAVAAAVVKRQQVGRAAAHHQAFTTHQALAFLKDTTAAQEAEATRRQVRVEEVTVA